MKGGSVCSGMFRARDAVLLSRKRSIIWGWGGGGGGGGGVVRREKITRMMQICGCGAESGVGLEAQT